MSTGLNLEYREHRPGEWYYVLEDWDSPRGLYDWHDFATAYGPFPSLEVAEEHRVAYHSNPGGSVVLRQDGDYYASETVEKLVAEAPEATAQLERPKPTVAISTDYGLGY